MEQALRDTLLDPKATPEQRKQAQSSLLALQGKTENPNRFTVVPGGQQVDQVSGRVFTVPSQVLDNQTGRFIEQHQSQPVAAPPQAAIDLLKKDPTMAAQFDAKYGAGASRRALGA